jgi:hypothetical protein
MKHFELPSGVHITTHAPPPDDFDPKTASAPDLLRYGWPQRPSSHAPEFGEWLKKYGERRKFIEPRFEPLPINRLPQPSRPQTRAVAPLDSWVSRNWSGAAVQIPAGHSAQRSHGEFFAMEVDAPGDGDFWVGQWVGIGNGALFQTGVVSHVVQAAGGTTRAHYAWWEWFPEPGYWIANMPIQAGDFCRVGVTATSYYTGRIDFMAGANQTSFDVSVDQTAANRLDTSLIEWIVEAMGSPTLPLGNFHTRVFAPFSCGFSAPGDPTGSTEEYLKMSASGLVIHMKNGGTDLTSETLISTILGDVLTIQWQAAQ